MRKEMDHFIDENLHRLPLLHGTPSQEDGSQYTGDGTVDIYKKPALKQSTGNWRACFFVLGAEFSLACTGIQTNLVTYLTSVFHESNIDAARNVSTWIGTSFLTQLIGAFLADTYWGKYSTVVIFLSVYTIGLVILTVSASLPSVLHSFSNSGIHRATFYLGLYLAALGTGGIEPCNLALGADQFDSSDAVEQMKKASFFNWYYFSINIGSLVSATFLVWVQDNVGWGVGFAIPMIMTILGLAVFISGRTVYRYKKLGESPMTRICQVVVAAVRNCHLKLPNDSSALYELPSPTKANSKAEHTNDFRFFDKAAIAIVVPACDNKSPWRLCTVSQVEELKTVLRMCPIWASMVIFFMVTAQMSSTFVEQGMTMDNRVGSFIVPPASLYSFDMLSNIVMVPVYDVVLVPLARRLTGKDQGLLRQQRLGIGLALSVAAMVYSALLEAKRLEAAAAAASAAVAPVSIMWQAPSYLVLGASEVFVCGGMLELFYDEAPASMKSLCSALGQLANAAGSYFNSAMLAIVASATARHGAPGWIPKNLNQGHLDYYFWTLAALSALNLLLFMHRSARYAGSTTS